MVNFLEKNINPNTSPNKNEMESLEISKIYSQSEIIEENKN